ncbi:MAG: DUF4982 domain-containing protein [Oscillospiraceae bacterium]|nr:DUF4982 domain-containing protein [Oscillospiraceae bacterium]
METRILNRGWRFALGEQEHAWLKGYDDSEWQAVALPHDWSVEHPFSTEYSSGTGYLPGGIGYYRLTFSLEESLRGKIVELLFDGIYNHSTVWINGYTLGGRPYGYTPLRFDVTPFVCFGDVPNVITVRADHREFADSRWFTGSGITRKVSLITRNPASVAPDGIFITTLSADENEASLRIHTRLENADGATVRHILFDAQNREAARTESTADKPDITQTLIVRSPQLWSPDSPSLYTCVTQIINTEIINQETVLDEVRTVVGVRTFRFDARKGFFLNGVSMKIKGVCVHHDAGCLGAAVRPAVWRRRLLSLKELGCNAIRTSHNPHMPELYDLCDQLGFLVMDEAFDEWEGVKNKWRVGHNVYPPSHQGYARDFPEWHERDLAAMVLRDRNHPSVILWSIGNEIDYPNDPYVHPLFEEMVGNNDANKPRNERIYDPTRPCADRLEVIARKLCGIVKRYDDTRPVTAALAYPELSNLTGFAAALDVAGYNYKENLYAEDHARFPDRPLLGSENGKELQQWKAVTDNEYVAGQFLWTGIDFLGETRGWPSHGSHAGLLDIAGFKKPIAYHRAAMWADTPVLKLYARRSFGADTPLHHHGWMRSWSFPEGASAEVICLTNAETAELFLDDEPLGVRAKKDSLDEVLRWKVPYRFGRISVRAGSQTDQLFPVGMPCGIRLQSDTGRLRADGQDIAHIVAEIVDSKGMRVPNAEQSLNIEISGGVLLGLENGNLEDTQPYALPYRRAFGGRLLIYIGAPEMPGSVHVRVWEDTLGSAEVTLLAE